MVAHREGEAWRLRPVRRLAYGTQISEDFIETALVENILGNAGIDPARAIIIYADYGNPYVYFGRLALRYFGAQQVRVFHDGI